MNEVPAEAWGRMIGFYRKLIDEYGFHQTPMLEFVSWLAASPYSRVLYPSTSHAALGLSAVPTFEERLLRPMVYLSYVDLAGFVIRWQREQGDEVREELVPSPKAPEVFDRILEWLGLPEHRLAEPAAGSDGG